MIPPACIVTHCTPALLDRYYLLCLSVRILLFALVFFHQKPISATVLLRLLRLPLIPMLPLSFTSNLAIVGTVLSYA
jgi:hypothetical protein